MRFVPRDPQEDSVLGAIAGDIIGSVYEAHPVKSTQFPLFREYSTFTDDTVLTVAIAYAILEGVDYARALKSFGQKYPHAGYGISFYHWMFSSASAPYNSWGNGSAMRVSPVGFAYNSLEEVLREAEKSACVTHNHPEGVKGAQATALAIFLARTGASKELIKQEVQKQFGYNLERSLDQIRPFYSFDVSCQGSVPESLICFLEAESFEEAVRNAVSLGGDSDTMACIAGGVAQAFFGGVPADILVEVRRRLPEEFLSIIERFYVTYGVK